MKITTQKLTQISSLINRILTYLAKKIKANSSPPYSELNQKQAQTRPQQNRKSPISLS
jgi:hypothetical protein